MSVARDTPPAATPIHSPAPAAAAQSAPLVRCDGVAAGFDGVSVVRNIDLAVHPGETVAIVGRSGCGKTTLLHVLAGLIEPSAGRVVAQPAALMPQRDGLMPWASARDNAALPLRVAGMGRSQARALAEGQLAALGLGGATDRRVSALSGGMRQRVALARTLLTGRNLLLLDEPLASVDALTRAELHELLLEHLARAGRGAVIVTHDLDEALLLADRVLILGPSRPNSISFDHVADDEASERRAQPAASTLRPGPRLDGAPGEPLGQRGGVALRNTLIAELRP